MTPLKKLNDSSSIPMIGFGTWKLKGEEATTVVKNAIAVGFRHIDTAGHYGNHIEVGQAIKDSGVDRKDIFLTTKVWRDRLHHSDLLADVDRFLEELGTDYIDLLLIHWPNHEVPLSETLKAMAECQEAGKIKAIGVSNFTEKHLEEAIASGVEIVNNQVELHPSFNQSALRAYCEQKNISVSAYSPLRSGDMELPLIKELAEKYHRSPAEIILNWVVKRGVIVISQTSDPEKMKANLSSTDFTIDEEDLKQIDLLPQGSRYNNPDYNEFAWR